MKTWVMTGVSSGFGVDWLYALDRQQEARWLLLARNPEAIHARLREQPLRGEVEVIPCNLASVTSVKSAIATVEARIDHLDGLINNAGLFPGSQRQVTEDGNEVTLAVNVLAPHRLTLALLPLLNLGSASRVITTASFRHRNANLEWDDLQLVAGYSAQRAYSNSKLCIVLWTRALAQRLRDSSVTVCCFDPGIVDTPMLRQATPTPLRALYPLLRPLVARSPLRGADTGIFLSTVTDPTSYHGSYVKDRKICRPHRAAMDDTRATWLWQQCEALSQPSSNHLR